MSIHTDLAKFIDRNIYTGKSRSEIARLSESLLPVYRSAVMDLGLPVYYAGDPPGISTLNYVVETSGIPKVFVIQYLSGLQAAAQAGEIDAEHWNPSLEAVKPVDVNPLQFAASQVSAAAGGIARTVTTIGVLAAIVYLLKVINTGQKLKRPVPF